MCVYTKMLPAGKEEANHIEAHMPSCRLGQVERLLPSVAQGNTRPERPHLVPFVSEHVVPRRAAVFVSVALFWFDVAGNVKERSPYTVAGRSQG